MFLDQHFFCVAYNDGYIMVLHNKQPANSNPNYKMQVGNVSTENNRVKLVQTY